MLNKTNGSRELEGMITEGDSYSHKAKVYESLTFLDQIWQVDLEFLFEAKCQIMASQGLTSPKWVKLIFLNFKVKFKSS